MSEGHDLDKVLQEWPYDPGSVSVRLVEGVDGREVIQMRIELGIMQLETMGRPDGWHPEGADSYYDHLLQLEFAEHEDFHLSDEQCFECDREFVQFYHRRICWLAMHNYARAVADADHTLGLMDFCLKHGRDEQWKLSHEQYRPFVMYHRIQAFAMSQLAEDRPGDAVQSINAGLEELRRVFASHDLEEQFEGDELVQRLVELRESLREQYDVGRTLHEQLEDAVAAEQYELAASLRDQLQKHDRGAH